MTENPYQPPKSDLETGKQEKQFILASRWKRLVASFIDSIIIILILLPVMYFTNGFDEETTSWVNTYFYELFLGVVGIITFAIINGNMLLSSGQTVGKKLLSIYIVDYSSESVPAKKSIINRSLVYLLVPYLPVIGSVASFINVVVIFGKERLCLHDHYAKTKVVEIVD